LTAVDADPLPPGPPSLPAGAVLITDDGRGVAGGLASLLQNAGWPVVVSDTTFGEQAQTEKLIEDLRCAHSRIAAIIHLLPLRQEAFPATAAAVEQQITAQVKGLFQLAKAAAIDLRAPGQPAATVLAATCLGGDFGVTAVRRFASSPIQGGVAGLLKTLAHEWPEARCKVIDFEPGVLPSLAAQRLFAEFSAEPGASSVEIGYQDGRRVQLRITPASLHAVPPTASHAHAIFDCDPVVLITGGARGITAKTALALASRNKARLIVVGRSQLPPENEPADTAGIESAAELKRILIDQIRRTGADAQPGVIEAAYTRLLREREIRSNLQALRETGSEIQYRQCDLANAEGFERLVDDVYSDYGAIDGVIHGAGVIEDRLVEEKDSASFDRVITAKVTGALVLARKLRFESLRFLVLFSSVSGRFGNRGQVDYAAANEILNKLAAHLDARWPCRVVAVNWGPWDGSNMVGPAVREQFLRRGVQLIDPGAGCEALLRELSAGSKGNPEIILGGGPWSTADASTPRLPGAKAPTVTAQHLPLLDNAPLVLGKGGAFEIKILLDSSRHLYLKDHLIDGKEVLPAAMAVELMTEAARKGWPDWVVTGIRSVRVCKGVVLDRIPLPLRITAKPPTHYGVEDAGLEVDVEINDPERSTLVYYRGTVCLADRLPEPPTFTAPHRNGHPPSSLTATEAYRDRLFHGPTFQCLTRIHYLTKDGAHAAVRPSKPGDCLRTQATSWIVDPVLLDAGPQLAILWAQEARGMTALPSRIGEMRLFRTMPDEAALECRFAVDHAADDLGIDATIRADFDVFYPDGRLVMSVQGLESTASRFLNRLHLIGAVDLNRSKVVNLL
jgi:NAD(P)-dependent dehydrogenase (short-subunit alcohol dehydrogenase family)